MAPRARIPAELKTGPFTVREAETFGISRAALRGRSWTRLECGLYSWTGMVVDCWRTLAALQRLLPGSVYSGRTAGWLLGLDLEPNDPIEIVMPLRSGVRSRRGLAVHRSDLTPSDIRVVRSLRVTTPIRTVVDLCQHLTGADALAVLDGVIRLKLADRAALARTASPLVRALAPLAEPAESPMETRLRWILLRAGLPRPQVQVNLHDAEGDFLGRADLCYVDKRLVIEFDGGIHRERLVADNRRQNLLMNAGFRVLRFSGSDVYNKPEMVVAQVSAAAAASARPRAGARR